MRFASVYRGFESLEDFESEISLLRTARDLGDVAATLSNNGEESDGGSSKSKPKS
jgi:hypothetical protein